MKARRAHVHAVLGGLLSELLAEVVVANRTLWNWRSGLSALSLRTEQQSNDSHQNCDCACWRGLSEQRIDAARIRPDELAG